MQNQLIFSGSGKHYHASIRGVAIFCDMHGCCKRFSPVYNRHLFLLASPRPHVPDGHDSGFWRWLTVSVGFMPDTGSSNSNKEGSAAMATATSRRRYSP